MEFNVLSDYQVVSGYIVGFSPVKRSFNPDQSEAIHNHFMKIVDIESLMKFVKAYGLIGINQTYYGTPGNDESLKVWDEITLLLDDEKLKKVSLGEPGTVSFDSIRKILEEAEKMRRVYDVLRSPEKFPDRHEGLKTLAKHNVKAYMREKKYISAETAATIISFKIQGRNKRVKYDGQKKNEPVFIPTIEYTHLLPAIWFGLYNTVIEISKPFKECPYCHSWHTGRGKFCPPFEHQEISSCAHNYKINSYRQRKRSAE